MSVESLTAELAMLRGAAIAYRDAVNTALAAETSLVSTLAAPYRRDPTRALAELQAAENRLMRELRVVDTILRPHPPAGRPPVTNLLPDGKWTAIATVQIRETYELEFALTAGDAADVEEAAEKIKWEAMGMTAAQARRKYRDEKNTNNLMLPTYVEVTQVADPEFTPYDQDDDGA